ncbi:Gfo/Idh/MocA family protein [Brachybacterium alimentarium]|uniref:Gfo/Idh/MocA family protein n=1 Tax=Brachybacterium alimentarium TaxID=47845 RepID=UPI000BB97BDE|nr:Gfo/Idh/MocA family oxidoreductase [Brachybacterium alimentarium]PCC30784.1 oxidoreductase [Brachybacterium alimentarium]RCS68432.1 gfo/Idh/MocA family oxidoreductase [Brachybacterium alimentarium]
MTRSSGPVGVGIIGAGVIAAQYLDQLTTYPDIEVRAIGDLRPEAAAARAAEYDVPRHGPVDVVLEDPEIEIVVNLTIPAAHFAVSLSILDAGKHVWTEKPLVTTRDDASALLSAAEERGLRVGGAPDTVLGAGVQTALRALHDGEIGEPRSALAQFRSRGPESWHPQPDFLFQVGGGPLYDMGPYYLTSLVLAYGPVVSVSAVGSQSVSRRTIGSGPRAGESFEVEVPTRVQGLLRFAGGTGAAVEFSFDAAIDQPHVLELSGAAGTLALPDPNQFAGETSHAASGDEDWTEREPVGAVGGRGLGTLEMARALRADRPHRLSGDLAAHVLDIMISLDEATRTDGSIAVASSVTVPDLLPEDFDPFAPTL